MSYFSDGNSMVLQKKIRQITLFTKELIFRVRDIITPAIFILPYPVSLPYFVLPQGYS
jgi:hypothetical protein